MKKLIFIFLLLIIPVVYANSQDDKGQIQQGRKQTKIILKEEYCKDCQGTGWLYTINYLNSTGVKYAGSSSNRNTNSNRAVELTTMTKMVCPYCGGKKTIFREYILYE